jgi:hypothetical protein
MSLSRDECGAGSVPRKIAWEKPQVDVLIFRATANGGGPGTQTVSARRRFHRQGQRQHRRRQARRPRRRAP